MAATLASAPCDASSPLPIAVPDSCDCIHRRCSAEVVCGLPAVRWILREAPLDELIECGRRDWDQARHGGRVRLQDLGDEAGLPLPLERPSPGHHLVQDGTEGEDVGACVRLEPLYLLRGHVLQRADNRPVRGEIGRSGPS